MANPIVNKPVEQPARPIDIFANLARESGKLMQNGHLLYREAKVFLSNQCNLLKKHDKELFPVILVAASVTMLFASNLLMLVASFSAGALYAVAKGDKWKDSIVKPITEIWEGSRIGKIGVIAFLILFVAPQKWNIAAFGLGIYLVQLLRKKEQTEKSTDKKPEPGPAVAENVPVAQNLAAAMVAAVPVPPAAQAAKVVQPAQAAAAAVAPAIRAIKRPVTQPAARPAAKPAAAPPQQARAPAAAPIVPQAAPQPAPAAPALPPAVMAQLQGLLQVIAQQLGQQPPQVKP